MFFSNLLGEIDTARNSEYAVEPWDTNPVPPSARVRRVVFVIHSIRDEGHWTQKIGSWARREFVAQGFGSRDEIAVITSGYGYFSMLQFLRYGERVRKVQWLVEEYFEAKRRYPQARFSFIGHSHGTYLAAHALERYPEIKFERLAFAGSVVSTKLKWPEIYKRGQCEFVANYAATADWVVGIFPRVADLLPLRWLLGPSLGGAGVELFPASEFLRNVCYRNGQHAAAIEEENWPYLAQFAVGVGSGLPENESEDSKTHYSEKPSVLFRAPWGTLTCLGGWAVLLGVLVVYFPFLAWTNPVAFWLVSLLPIGIALPLVALTEEQGRGVSFAERKTARRRARWILVTTTFLILGWLLVATPLLVILGRWGGPSPEFLRTISVVVYAAFVNLALTKV